MCNEYLWNQVSGFTCRQTFTLFRSSLLDCFMFSFLIIQETFQFDFIRCERNLIEIVRMFKKLSLKILNSQGSSDDYSDKSLLIGGSEGSAKSYGTENIDAIVPIEDRLTYTWKEIDVYGEQPVEGSLWSRIGKKINSCVTGNGKEFVARKHLLKNITGVAHSGELLAVLGASGAGKTTLLNALSFRSPPGVKV